VRPLSLDHIAFWVADRRPIVERCERHLAMRVIEEQEGFTLVGADARRGKLTFFDADAPRTPGVLRHIGLRVADLAAARASLLPGEEASLELGEGIVVRLVERETDVDYDLDHVALVTSDPEATATAFEPYGFSRVAADAVSVGDARLVFERGEPDLEGPPLLNHLGLRVDDAEEHRCEAQARGLDIESVVDAPNTYAVFLNGPDGIPVEYVEHKPTFALA
jgi:catechol 2,3-dioxygenase-like lactoylglutathione lyase family enzyme